MIVDLYYDNNRKTKFSLTYRKVFTLENEYLNIFMLFSITQQF